MTSESMIYSESDTGIYDALNKGIEKSSGDVIGILHSDDTFFNNDVLQKINMKFSKDSSLDIIVGRALIVKGQPPQLFRVYPSRRLHKLSLMCGLMPPHTSMYVRRRVYEKHGRYKLGYKIAADFDFLCRISKDKSIKILYLDEPLVIMKSGGASSQSKFSFIKNSFEIKRALKENDMLVSSFLVYLRIFPKLLELLYAKVFYKFMHSWR